MTRKNLRRRKIEEREVTNQSEVVAIEVRGQQFALCPNEGYLATVILLDEYLEWFDRLKDRTAQARIAYAVGKLARGLPGDRKEVGGVYEVRIDYGPGYRLYFGKHGDAVFILALGGDKTTQRTDIATAIRIWNEVTSGFKEIRK